MDTWKQDTTSPTDCWERSHAESGGDIGYIRRYDTSNDYLWQVFRSTFHLAGNAPGRDLALAAADAALGMPIEEFNALVAADLKIKLLDLEKELLRLEPSANFTPGFRIGFEAGQAYVKEKIMEVMP